MKKITFLLLASSLFIFSCKKNDVYPKDGIFKGEAVNVHAGKAWTSVQLNSDGSPMRISVTLDDAAMNSVVESGRDNSGHDHANMENNFILKFHNRVSNLIPFNHVGMGWNPIGHEPEPIYGIRHFDFHFYIPTPAEIAAIPAYEADSMKFKNAPGPDYFPLTYINPGGGVPKMGSHWVDVTSSEFHGQRFTQTFIYGSFNGKVTFYEPMITWDFLRNSNNFTRNIPQPGKVQKTGFYPSKLSIQRHDGVTDVILEGFSHRVQS